MTGVSADAGNGGAANKCNPPTMPKKRAWVGSGGLLSARRAFTPPKAFSKASRRHFRASIACVSIGSETKHPARVSNSGGVHGLPPLTFIPKATADGRPAETVGRKRGWIYGVKVTVAPMERNWQARSNRGCFFAWASSAKAWARNASMSEAKASDRKAMPLALKQRSVRTWWLIRLRRLAGIGNSVGWSPDFIPLAVSLSKYGFPCR